MSNTRIYRIQYPVTSFHEVRVSRPVDITEADLLTSVTRDDLANSEEVTDTWDILKDVAGEGTYDLILDEEGEEIEFSN